MRIAIFPTKRIGAEVMRYLMAYYPDHIQLVVYENRNSELFREYGALKPYLFYDEVYSKLDYVRSLDLDWIFLAWWPHIVKADLIAIPKQGVINTHNSLLPFNRGVHPNFWAIVEKKPYGVTIHRVTPGVDDGDIIAQEPVPYDWTDTGDTVYEKGMKALTELFHKTYPKLIRSEYSTRPQDHSQMTLHKTREIDQAVRIDLAASYKAEDLLNLIRAKDCLNKPAAYFEHDKDRYEVRVSIKKIPAV